MSSKIESGINTYIGHFDRLISVCESFGAAYDPVPVNLQIASLKAQSTLVKAAIMAVDTQLPVYVATDGARQETFAQLTARATRVQAAATVLGLPDSIMVHVKEVVRKIRGQRAHKITQDADGTGEPAKHVSVSQRSFNEQIEHLNQLIAFVGSQSAYTPVEQDITVAGLMQLLEDMKTTNAATMTAEASLTGARQERDRLLYEPKTGMMPTALTVKEYVKAVFGASSPQYREVNHITFKNQKP
jgi:hypothetical protein